MGSQWIVSPEPFCANLTKAPTMFLDSGRNPECRRKPTGSTCKLHTKQIRTQDLLSARSHHQCTSVTPWHFHLMVNMSQKTCAYQIMYDIIMLSHYDNIMQIKTKPLYVTWPQYQYIHKIKAVLVWTRHSECSDISNKNDKQKTLRDLFPLEAVACSFIIFTVTFN